MSRTNPPTVKSCGVRAVEGWSATILWKGVPMNTLDSPSRRRVDALYREAYIQHMLSLGSEPPASEN